MSSEIKNICIIGMGALGLLFGQIIKDNDSDGNVYFLMNEERKNRHKNDLYLINGNEVHFDARTPEELSAEKADLLLIATKYNDLGDAIELAKYAANDQTTIISLLNGITSEEIIAKAFKREQIIDCVPIGMDAMRDGTSLTYTKTGMLQIGVKDPGQQERLSKLAAYFKSISFPHEVCDDIERAMWKKFMMNVGINQTCMVYEASYSQVFNDATANADLEGAMHEVMNMAKAVGVSLTEEDYDKGLEILHTLSPDGYPSMRQDALAKRKSEVEMFAKEMIRLSKIHNVPVPVNEKFYKKILEMEAGY